MSAFGDYAKDDIVDSIKLFVQEKKEQDPQIQISKLVEEVMEAVGYGLRDAIWTIEN
jgi:hypothetical protein